MKKLKYGRNFQKRSSKQVTEVDPNFSVRDHKQARSEIRSKLQEGYFFSHSGKKAIRVVHCLGRCYMLLGVDYLSFSYAGLQFPASDDYDTVCKWCARATESKGRSGVFRYKHFVVFRRVRLPHEGSVELSALLSIEDPGSASHSSVELK